MLMDQGAVEVTRDKGDVFASLTIQSVRTRLKVVFSFLRLDFLFNQQSIDLLISIKKLHL
jgi:hypothetical protein